MKKNELLVTQSFIVNDEDSYWDYRDYIFSLCSNLSIKDAIFRLNIERGGKWIDEFKAATKFYKFSDIEITNYNPQSWSNYMLENILCNQTLWTMPFPGDHIYINPDNNAYLDSLKKGEEINADAVAYSHIQDFEYLIDWDRIKILYNDNNYVMIKWGYKYKYYRNEQLIHEVKKRFNLFLIVTPLPAFLTYRSDFFKEILKAMPANSKRWQDMEYSPAKRAWGYKLLIPKKCLYRHVHGYWLECYFEYRDNKIMLKKDNRLEIKSSYIKSKYDWRKNFPNTAEYREICFKKHPYFKKYFENKEKTVFVNKFFQNPFDFNYKRKRSFMILINNLYKNIRDNLKRIGSYLINKLRKIK